MVSAKYYGPAHTGGDIVVLFEKANVAHMGDLVFNRRQPFIDRPGGASIQGWITLLEQVAKAHGNDTIFVFGHAGDGFKVTGGKADLQDLRDYLTALLDVTRKAKAGGQTREAFIKTTTPVPGFTDYRSARRTGDRRGLGRTAVEICWRTSHALSPLRPRCGSGSPWRRRRGAGSQPTHGRRAEGRLDAPLQRTSLDGWRAYKRPDATGTRWVVQGRPRCASTLATAPTREARATSSPRSRTRSSSWPGNWRISPGGNSGVRYFVLEDRDAAIGHEYQLIDDAKHPDAKIGPHRQTAAALRRLPAADGRRSRPASGTPAASSCAATTSSTG